MPSAVLRVLASPGARANAVEWMPDGRLRVRIAAPPVDGKANRELTGYLADILGVAPSAVRVLKGSSARFKTIEVDGLDDGRVAEAIGRRISS